MNSWVFFSGVTFPTYYAFHFLSLLGRPQWWSGGGGAAEGAELAEPRRWRRGDRDEAEKPRWQSQGGKVVEAACKTWHGLFTTQETIFALIKIETQSAKEHTKITKPCFCFCLFTDVIRYIRLFLPSWIVIPNIFNDSTRVFSNSRVQNMALIIFNVGNDFCAH